jgi:hypothetical protein
MITPRKEDIGKFRDFNVEAFENWMRIGLEGVLLDNLGVGNFRPLEYCIFREHNVSADLRIIYDAFPAEQKAMIRAAVARLIDHLPPERRYAPIFRTLFDLAAAIQAFEVLKVLPARGERFLAIERESLEVPSLYRAALDLVVELRDRSADAKACIDRLVGTPGSFESGYTRPALIALCRIAPDHFIEHMALLRTSIAQNFQKFHPTKESKRWLVNDIVKAVGLGIIQSNWSKLHIVDEPVKNQPTDNWFRDTLLLMLKKEGAGTSTETIVWRPDPAIRVIAAAADFRPLGHDTEESESSKTDPLQDIEPYPVLADEMVTEQEQKANVTWGVILLGLGKRSAAIIRGIRR